MIKKYKQGNVVAGVAIGWSFIILVPGFLTLAMGILGIFQGDPDAIENLAIGFITTLIWSLLILRSKGIIIDFENQTIQTYKSILGFKYGETLPVSEYPYFRIRHISKSSSFMVGVAIESSYSTQSLAIEIYHKPTKTKHILQKEEPSVLDKTRIELEEKLGMIRKGK